MLSKGTKQFTRIICVCHIFFADGELMDTDESFSPVSSSIVQHVLELLPESPKKKAEPRWLCVS